MVDMRDCYSAGVTEQTASYSIEIKDQANERLAIFTFIDLTADEVQTVLAEFRRHITDMATVINVLASTRA